MHRQKLSRFCRIYCGEQHRILALFVLVVVLGSRLNRLPQELFDYDYEHRFTEYRSTLHRSTEHEYEVASLVQARYVSPTMIP